MLSFQNQNDTKTLKKWMAEVDIFLNEDWPALGNSETLEKQLEQCTVSFHFMLYFMDVNIMCITVVQIQLLSFCICRFICLFRKSM